MTTWTPSSHNTPPPSPLPVTGTKRKAGALTSSEFTSDSDSLTGIHSGNPRKCLRIEIPPTRIIPLVSAPDANDTASAVDPHNHNDDDHHHWQGCYSPSSLFSALSFSGSSTPPDTIISGNTANHHHHPQQIPTTPLSKPALLTAPPIPGLHFHPTLQLPQDLADTVFNYCMSTYFHNHQQCGINQVMLFTRHRSGGSNNGSTTTDTNTTGTQLPPILTDLLTTLSSLLLPYLPTPIHTLLFPPTPSDTDTDTGEGVKPDEGTSSRQVILNLYTPGEGISPHIDLLNRFGDGIIGISLGSGCVMQFTHQAQDPVVVSSSSSSPSLSSLSNPVQDQLENTYDLYLPSRSILILSSDARYKWTHGIPSHKADFVACPPPASSTHDLHQDEGRGEGQGQDESKSTGKEQAEGGEGGEVQGRWIERSIRLSLTFRWLLPGADIVGSPFPS